MPHGKSVTGDDLLRSLRRFTTSNASICLYRIAHTSRRSILVMQGYTAYIAGERRVCLCFFILGLDMVSLLDALAAWQEHSAQ